MTRVGRRKRKCKIEKIYEMFLFVVQQMDGTNAYEMGQIHTKAFALKLLLLDFKEGITKHKENIYQTTNKQIK